MGRYARLCKPAAKAQHIVPGREGRGSNPTITHGRFIRDQNRLNGSFLSASDALARLGDVLTAA